MFAFTKAWTAFGLSSVYVNTNISGNYSLFTDTRLVLTNLCSIDYLIPFDNYAEQDV